MATKEPTMPPAPVANLNLAALLQNHQAGEGRKPIVCLEGSARSGKTWSVLEYLTICCLDMPGLVVTCYRHDSTTHQGSTIRDWFLLLAAQFPRTLAEINRPGGWNATEKRARFRNGSVMEFSATNDVSKLHGPQRHIAWLNEAMEVSYEAWNQLSTRTSIETIMDWNPSLAHHWIYDRVLTRPDVMLVKSTYRDNPHLLPQQIAEIEKYNPDVPANVANGTADAWLWAVYGLGQRGRREGTIYEAWDVTDTWPGDTDWQKAGFGVDFGFASDPCAVIECGICRGDLWLREAVYETGLVIRPSESMPGVPSVIGRMREAAVSTSDVLCCDGARPDSVRDLQIGGYPLAVAVAKGKGSILEGITLLRGWKMHVHRASQNIQRELEQYSWKKNRATGEWLDEPEDANNHAMDAIRYWAMDNLSSAPRWQGGKGAMT